MAHASPPALHTDDRIALAEHTELDGVHDTPLQAAVNVLLPWLCLEVGLLFGEIEWVDAAVQVRVLLILAMGILVPGKATYPSCHVVTSDHNNGAHWAVLGHEPGRGATNAR